MSVHYANLSSFAVGYSGLISSCYMDNEDDAYPHLNAGESLNEHFHNGCANEYTAYSSVHPLLQLIPDCSSHGTGPWVASEVPAPNWLHEYIFGDSGNVAEKLTKQLPHIGISLNGNKMVIEGPSSQVSIAEVFFKNYTAIMKSTVVFEDVPVHRKLHPQIIGKYSEKVDRIQKETFTTIYFPTHVRRTGVVLPYDVIRIQGYPTSVEAAKKAILQIAAQVDGGANNTVQGCPSRSLHKITRTIGKYEESHEQLGGDLEDESYSEVLHVDKNIIKHLVGRRRATVKKIEVETNTKIQVPDELTEEDAFVVTGKRENVKFARKCITDFEQKIKIVLDRVSVPFEPTDMTDDLKARQAKKKLSSYKETIEVDPDVLPKVIGARCAIITELAEKHDVHIEIPPNCSDYNQWESVTIFGTESKVKAAKDDLQELIKEKEAYTSESVYIDPTVYGRLIGPKGQTISEIESQFDVKVKFPKPRPAGEQDPVTIRGRKDEVIKAKRRLLFLESKFLHIDAVNSRRTFKKDSSGFMYFKDPPSPS